MLKYTFAQLGTIPGIPGEFSAGSVVIVDEETMQVVEILPKHEPTQKKKDTLSAKKVEE